MPTPRVQAAAEGTPEFIGYRAAFERLEGPIGRLVELSKVQETLISMTLDFNDKATLAGDCKDAISFITSEIRTEVDKLDTLWLDSHNAAPDEEPTSAVSDNARVPLMGNVR